MKKIVLLIVLGALFCLSSCSSSVTEYDANKLYNLQEQISHMVGERITNRKTEEEFFGTSTNEQEQMDHANTVAKNYQEEALTEIETDLKVGQRIRIQCAFSSAGGDLIQLIVTPVNNPDNKILCHTTESFNDLSKGDTIEIEGVVLGESREFSHLFLADCKLIK